MPSTAVPPEVEKFRDEDGAVVVVDHEGLIVLMNKPAEELFGIAESDIAGEFVEMLVPQKLRWGHQAYRRGYQAEPSEREMDPGLEPHLERPMDEVEVPIAVHLEPIRVDGKLFVVAHVQEREE